MGLSTSKSTQTQNQNTTQTGTTTPQAPPWVTDSLQNYLGGIDAMSGADPSSFVAGASPLQQQAWSNADRLGQWTGNSNAASNIALNAANAPASQVPGAAGYNAARMATPRPTAPPLWRTRARRALRDTMRPGPTARPCSTGSTIT
jgi:23S rRNA A2030 N6-methylase RlmJ